MLTKSQQLVYEIIRCNGGVEDKTKLAKLQYFADFIHYAFNDSQISEQSYIYTRQKQGPLGRNLTADLAALKADGVITEPSEFNYGIAKEIETDLSKSEAKTIKFVLEKYGKLSWHELMNISHDQEPYLSTTDGGIIEPFTAYNLVDLYPDYASA
jgi:uncharacterized phage-associated protein